MAHGLRHCARSYRGRLARTLRRVKRWTWRPALRLRARVRRPDADKVSRWAQFADGRRVELGESWYFRLAVFNEGNETAEEVQVFLARVERKHGHKFEKVSRFTPMNLRWHVGNSGMAR
jgi:hypothetical protein